MNNNELSHEKKDALKRLENMSRADILNLSHENLIRLACQFFDEQIVRIIVAKGESQGWQERILEHIEKAYQYWFYHLPFLEQNDYIKRGYNGCTLPYFEEIAYDIATNQPILPSEEEEEENLTCDTPDDIQAELEDLREQVEQFRNKEKGTSLGLNQAQAALFGLSLAKTFGFKYSNKKKELAPLLHKLFGWGEAKLAYYLSCPCENEERDELANLFKDLCPPLYATIMNRGELPQ